MFDKYRERFAKFEEDHESVRKIRMHVEKNGKVYLVGAGCLGAGYLVRGKVSPEVVQTFTDSRNNVGTVINRSKNVDVIIQYVKARNYVANPVRCLETGEEWPSQIEAAIAKTISPAVLSQHLNGKLEHANRLHYTRM